VRAAFWFVAVLFQPVSVRAQATLILQQGDPAPDGSTYRSFGRAESAGAGRVAFVGRTDLLRGALFIATSVPGATIAEVGDILAGSGVTLRRMFRPAANAGGDTAWPAHVSGAFGGGIFSSLAANDVVLARSDSVGMGVEIRDLDRPSLSDNGEIVVHAQYTNLDEVLLRCSGGDHNCHSGTGTREELVAINDVYFDSVQSENRIICRLSGQVDASNWGIVFRALTAKQTAGCAGAQQETILRMPYGGVPQTVATADETALPANGKRKYLRFDGSAIDNEGDVAVLGETVEPVQEVIYFCPVATCPATLPLVVASQRMDDGAGRAIGRFKAIGISDLNDVSFQAIAAAPDLKTLSIYIARYPAWTLERVAANKEPSPVPGAEFGRLGRPSMSSDGYVTFEAQAKTDTTRPFAFWSYH
jgi:hypothetical protein